MKWSTFSETCRLVRAQSAKRTNGNLKLSFALKPKRRAIKPFVNEMDSTTKLADYELKFTEKKSNVTTIKNQVQLKPVEIEQLLM